jgi:hypothetical protein
MKPTQDPKSGDLPFFPPLFVQISVDESSIFVSPAKCWAVHAQTLINHCSSSQVVPTTGAHPSPRLLLPLPL